MQAVVSPWSELGVFGPELALIGTIAAVLAGPLIRGKRSNVVAGITAGLGLFIAIFLLLAVNSWGQLAWHPMAHSPRGGVGGEFFGPAGAGLLVMDPFGWLFKLCVLVLGLIAVGLWMVATRDRVEEGQGVEFFALFLTALLGLLLMGSTTNLLMMWMALEIAALPGYALVGFSRPRNGKPGAAMNWALGGMVCSAVMVYGISMLYGISGSLELAALRHVADRGGVAVWLGLAAVLLGVAGKVLLAPLHVLAVDALEGASLEVGALLTVGYMGAGLAMVLRCAVAIGGSGTEMALMALGAVMCFWGTIAALKQRSIKRLLGYSSLAHGGYMLLAVALAAGGGDGGGEGGVEGWLFYLCAYVVMNAGAFAAAGAIEQRLAAETLDDYAGLNQRCPILAASMAVMVGSLVGVPMTIGFGAKMKLCQVLFDGSGGGGAGPQWIGYAGLGVLAVCTVLGAVSYMRIVRQMYFVKTDLPAVFEIVPATLLAGALAAVNIVMFVGYGWMEAGVRAFASMWRP